MEKKISLIPNVVVQGIAGVREYGILLTDVRSIFVLEKANYSTVNYFLGGVPGMVAGSLLAERKVTDYSQEDLERLAQTKENIVVPYSQIHKISIKKTMISPYKLSIEYTDTTTGKNKRIQAWVIPPKDLIKQKKTEGIKQKNIVQEYVKKVQEAFERSLPQSVLFDAGWTT